MRWIDKRGATKGARPKADTRSAVWVAPGSGLVISTDSQSDTLVKQPRTVDVVQTFAASIP